MSVSSESSSGAMAEKYSKKSGAGHGHGQARQRGKGWLKGFKNIKIFVFGGAGGGGPDNREGWSSQPSPPPSSCMRYEEWSTRSKQTVLAASDSACVFNTTAGVKYALGTCSIRVQE